MRRIAIAEQGAPEVLQVVDAETPDLGPGEVLVRVHASGVNFVDLFQRSGAYTVQLPFTPGMEGSGVVERVGPEVDAVAEGDRVAWAAPTGSYASHCVVKAERLVPVPENLDLDLAAAVLIHGMTAHCLATDVVSLREGDVCLVHAAAGGVGGLLTQYAVQRGATVIGTVSSPQKAEAARAAGASHVIDYAADDFPTRVKEITDGRGVNVVFDAVGRDTFADGIACLRRRGTFVLYGQTSGKAEPIDPAELGSRGSLYLTKVSLGCYDPKPKHSLARATTVFGDVLAGRLRPRVHGTYALDDAATAHAAIESRQTVGKVLLRP